MTEAHSFYAQCTDTQGHKQVYSISGVLKFNEEGQLQGKKSLERLL